MVKIAGPPSGAIRNRPINEKLARVLASAAEAAGIETLQIVSGGQPGTTGRRTGSHRHDGGNAADLKLIKGGRALSFVSLDERPIIETFVTAAAANGATGIGAGIHYMGPQTLHVGFGSKVVWGAQGAAANAPQWLKDAVEKGWKNPETKPSGGVPEMSPEEAIPAGSGSNRYVVIARDGVQLRGGPGNEFDVIRTLAAGTELTAVAFEGAQKEWALIDIENDGLVDGFVLTSFLAAANAGEDKDQDHDDSHAGNVT